MNHTKTITSDNTVTRLVWSCVLTIGLAAALIPQANAHDTSHRPAGRYDHYQVEFPRHGVPRWLRKDQAFKRWYLSKPYKRVRHVGWNRLYDMYLIDVRHHQKMSRAKRRHHQHRHASHYDYAPNQRDHDHDRDRRDRDRRSNTGNRGRGNSD